jgi:hypothetical protein
MANPLLPAWPDLLSFLAVTAVAAVGCTVLVLWFLALNGIAKATALSDTARAVWVLIVVLAPVLGSVVWFAIGRPAAATTGLSPGARVPGSR